MLNSLGEVNDKLLKIVDLALGLFDVSARVVGEGVFNDIEDGTRDSAQTEARRELVSFEAVFRGEVHDHGLGELNRVDARVGVIAEHVQAVENVRGRRFGIKVGKQGSEGARRDGNLQRLGQILKGEPRAAGKEDAAMHLEGHVHSLVCHLESDV